MGRVAALSKFLSRVPATRKAWSPALVTACLLGVCCGCLNLRGMPFDIPMQNPPVEAPALSATQPSEPTLSGALDGPTLRLALRDLAVILDTLGRLEQVRPDLKPQMLRELADADAATAAAVVSRWRTRLPELQANADRVRIASLETKTAEHASSDGAPNRISASATLLSNEQPSELSDRPEDPAKRSAGDGALVERTVVRNEPDIPLLLESVPDEDSPELPSWDDLLESLVGMTRDRAEELGPDAARARMQLALLELVRRSQESGSDATMPDSQLWTHLDPAIQYCFGSGTPSQTPPQEVVRSLQVATELLRGPGRFQVRGLAFCTRIRGFGNIDRVQANAFTPGQAVLLYSEIEHFFSDPEPGGFFHRDCRLNPGGLSRLTYNPPTDAAEAA